MLTFHTQVCRSSSFSPNGEHSDPTETSQFCLFISSLSFCYGQNIPVKSAKKSFKLVVKAILQASMGRFCIAQLFLLFTCRQDVTSAYAPINSKVQHPPRANPRATPRAFELLKIGLFKFPPLGAKKPFKCPTN